MGFCMRNVKQVSKLLNIAKSEEIQWISLGSYRQLLRKHSTFPGFHRYHRHLLHTQGVSPGFLRNAKVVCGVLPVRTNATTTSSSSPPAAATAAGAGTDNVTTSTSPTVTGTDLSLPDGYIPEPPALPPLPDVPLNALGEPSLASMDMASWYPSGIVQWGLESLHVGLDVPWWGAIVIGTVCIRLLMFPLVILSQRNAANMANHMPTVQRLQQKFTHARMSGNPMEASRVGEELQSYMLRNKVNPFKNLMVPLAQMPIFLSVFVGVRQMANYPVLSMKQGGILWFADLTLTDPFYLLPLMTMATLFMTIEDEWLHPVPAAAASSPCVTAPQPTAIGQTSLQHGCEPSVLPPIGSLVRPSLASGPSVTGSVAPPGAPTPVSWKLPSPGSHNSMSQSTPPSQSGALPDPDHLPQHISSSVPVTVKISMLQLRFTMHSTRCRSATEDLESIYRMQAAELETQRYRDLCHSPWMNATINQHYDGLHLALIGRIEASLGLLDKKTQLQRLWKKYGPETPRETQPETSPSTDYKRKPNNFTALDSVAVRIMSSWYERNKEHPYPSYDTCEVMAKAARLTVEQVKKWFANRRLREGNTKSLTEIASRRKRTRTEAGSPDILLAGCKRLRD